MHKLNTTNFLSIFFFLCCLIPWQLSAQGSNLFADNVLHEIRFTEVDTSFFIQSRDYQMVNMSIDGTSLNDIGFRKKGNISASHPNS